MRRGWRVLGRVGRGIRAGPASKAHFWVEIRNENNFVKAVLQT